MDENHDFENDPLLQSHARGLNKDENAYPPPRPQSIRSGQRIDMSTGETTTIKNNAFGFDQEEGSYALQRLQSHLSERSSQFHRRPSSTKEVQSRRRKFKRKTNSWTSRTVESFQRAIPRKSKNA